MRKFIFFLILIIVILILFAGFFWLYETKFMIGRASVSKASFSIDNSYLFVSPLRARANDKEKIRVTVFVLNNQGYLTIKLMQQNHFGRYVGSDPSSGLSCVDIIKVAKAYGIESLRLLNNQQLHEQIDRVLAQPGPYICEIMMPEDQSLIPRVSSLKKPDGTVISKPLEDLYPFLPREEFFENMIVKPKEILKD